MSVTDILSFKPTKREVLSGIAPHLFKEKSRRRPSQRYERRKKRSPLAVSTTSFDGHASSVILVSEASPQGIKGMINNLQEDASTRRGASGDGEALVENTPGPNTRKVFLRMKTVLFRFKIVKRGQKAKGAQPSTAGR